MRSNVFVLGLDEHNARILHELPDAAGTASTRC